MASGSICCVLRSGGDFRPEHVVWLKKMCDGHMPDWDFKVWSDVAIPGVRSYQLRSSWPKWWAKMEIYQTRFPGPALVIDLDTVFLDTLVIKPEHADQMLVIRDPWKDGGRHPERLAGGFMYLPYWARDDLWSIWRECPEEHMARFAGDDQPFLHKYFGRVALRFQDHYLDQIVSYKVHVKGIGLQPENKVVYFHGEPRPWNVDVDWIPKLGVRNGEV